MLIVIGRWFSVWLGLRVGFFKIGTIIPLQNEDGIHVKEIIQLYSELKS